MSDSIPAPGPVPFPGNPDRTIKLDSVPFGKTIARSVFKADELAWMDAEVNRIAENPDLWVPALMAHLEAHRILVLSIGKLARGSVGPLAIRRGFRLRAKFVADWNIYETLWRRYLTPPSKAELALQLRKHPYEAEVLRKSKYFGAAISGIQVESQQGTPLSGGDGEVKACPFCAEVIKAKAVVCRYCNRDLPADVT